MTEPTTRPWLVEQDGDGKFLIVAPQEDGNLLITGVLANLTSGQDEANATFIARAVNNLAPLMEALSALVDATANVIDVGPAYDQAVRVLKAAEEATR